MNQGKPINTPLTLAQHAAIKEALSIALRQHGADILQVSYGIFAALDTAAVAAGAPPKPVPQTAPSAPTALNRAARRATEKRVKK